MLEEDIFAIAVSSTHASLERVSGMRATIPYTIVIHACSGLCILMSSLTVYIEGETIEGKTKDLIYRRNGTTIPTETTRKTDSGSPTFSPFSIMRRRAADGAEGQRFSV